MYSYAFVCFQKSRQRNRATNSSTSGVDNGQYRAACTPHSTLCRSENSRSLCIFQRLPSEAANSARWLARHVKKCSLNEATTPRQNRHQKEQTASRASDQEKKNVFSLSDERCPRDASPVSVVFGVDRGQLLASRFAQLPFVATSTAC